MRAYRETVLCAAHDYPAPRHRYLKPSVPPLRPSHALASSPLWLHRCSGFIACRVALAVASQPSFQEGAALVASRYAASAWASVDAAMRDVVGKPDFACLHRLRPFLAA